MTLERIRAQAKNRYTSSGRERERLAVVKYKDRSGIWRVVAAVIGPYITIDTSNQALVNVQLHSTVEPPFVSTKCNAFYRIGGRFPKTRLKRDGSNSEDG